jgi:hypothetical protein
MSTSAFASLTYGICILHGTVAFTKLDTMDWTPVELLEKDNNVKVIKHGDFDHPYAYVIGVSASTVYAWEPCKSVPSPLRVARDHTEKLIRQALATLELEQLYLEPDEPMTLEWYLTVRDG